MSKQTKRNHENATTQPASKRTRKQANPATADTRKQLPPAPAYNANPAEIITAENVQTLAERFAVKALKTYYQKSGMPFLYTLYCGLIGDITERKNTGKPLSDGYDVAQTACAVLCGYIGKRLDEPSADGQTDKNGEPITIKTAVFRALSKYVNGERAHDFRRVYVDEIDENGETLYYEIPAEWDMPTATDYKHVIATINALNLTARQAQILRYRLRGLSIHQIAEKMSIHRKTLQEHIQAIQRKYNAYTQAQTANA